MLKRIRIYIINLFGFSKTEANGIIGLLIVVFLGFSIPPLFASFLDKPVPTEPSDLEEWVAEIESSIISEPKNRLIESPKFKFDPNLISPDSLQLLGLNPKLASRINNYRNAGGQFRKPQDLYKIYGIDSVWVSSVEQWVSIKKRAPASVVKKPRVKHSEKTPASTRPNPPLAKLPLNLADTTELKAIYGIGSKLAQRTIRYRESLGGFHKFDQIREVYYMQDSLIPKLEKRFFIDSSNIQQLNINADSLTEVRHPYLSRNQVRAIANYRENHGDFESIEQILKIKIIHDSTFQKIKPYLSTTNR